MSYTPPLAHPHPENPLLRAKSGTVRDAHTRMRKCLVEVGHDLGETAPT